MGEVARSSMVPERFSSANKRIVMRGMKKRPMTLRLETRPRMSVSLTFIGYIWPSLIDSML
jgi:hypothetical protein